MHFQLWQWALGGLAAVVAGISKTGMPSIGIIVAPLLAAAFGGWQALGVMLPMLIFSDIFAVAWYRRHAEWDKICAMLPWVLVGVFIAGVALWSLGKVGGERDLLSKLIGALVLLMLGMYFLQNAIGDDRLAPKSKFGAASAGSATGFAGTVSSGAGPIISIYLSALRMPKEQFMGTSAWFYLLLNLSKLPILLLLGVINPEKPMITVQTLGVSGLMGPMLVLGVFAGKWMLPRVSQRLFDTVVLGLSAVFAVKLLLG
ncbi:MAG: sulfite exporter TauE/SafE family protein [Armatimonadetes bacterium]|nr:sulfite exporter TauE/SafE family protein [Armatimonadota bacterium]